MLNIEEKIQMLVSSPEMVTKEVLDEIILHYSECDSKTTLEDQYELSEKYALSEIGRIELDNARKSKKYSAEEFWQLANSK